MNGFVIAPRYAVRFIKPCQANELINFWHLTKCALSGETYTRHTRMVLAAKWFSEKYPEVSRTAAYKDLDGLLA